MQAVRGAGAVFGALVLAIVGAIVVVAVLGSGSPAAPTATQVPQESATFGAVGTTETVPCPSEFAAGAAFAKAGDEVEGKTYSCGVVVVPEDRTKPDGRTIELFYLKLHSPSKAPAAEPMVYLAGGPGSSASYELTANPLLHDNLNRVRAERDIIAYDQRGSGYSNYLLCAPFEAAIGILQDRDKNPEISTILADLQQSEDGMGYGALRANLCGVGTQLLAGVDLGQYNSVASAHDIPQLVKALGYAGGYSLYGTSYGTRLAQEAMRSVPDGITGVILDGSSGTAIPNSMWSSLKNVSPYLAIFEQCEADAACKAAYPDIAKRFGALLEKLETQPLVFDPPLVVSPALSGGFGFPPVLKQIDKDFFVRLAAVDNLALGGAFAASMPRMIKAAEEGDTAYFKSIKLFNADAAPTEAPQTAVQPGKDPTPLLSADQPLFELPFQTLLAIAQQAQANAGASIDTQWLSVVLGDLAARLTAGENHADLMEALLRLAVLPNSGTTAKQLTDYANANLSPDAAAAANAVAGTMDRNDVRATMWSIQDIAMVLGAPKDERHFSEGMKQAVNCADELKFSSLDIARKDLADSPYPQLAVFSMANNEQILLTCLAYPDPADPSVTQPVTSDIPVLMFQGDLDNETPVGWAALVAETLGNATQVRFRNQGHVASAQDPKFCAGDIAATFLRDPSNAPDISCSQTDDYRLKFVLP